VGGHTVRDPEIKFGYAVTGIVDPERILRNGGGKPNEALILTKALGTGIVATALKAGRADGAVASAATAAMIALNRLAAEAARAHGASAATDVTGFGLVGHASNLARESRLTLEIRAAALPALPGALELAVEHQPGGLRANRRAYAPLVEVVESPDAAREALLYDPQTSGGLLVLLPEGRVAAFLDAVPGAAVIGRSREAGPCPISLC
jgi:selenide,water dikinase